MSYADKVRAGIALLDEQVPDWVERIDVVWLDLWDCHRCILGQLFGDYLDGLESVAVGEECLLDANAYGFAADDATFRDSAYRTLTRLWTFVIRQRQEAGVS